MTTVSRLIEQFAPNHYDISLTLDRVNRAFSGTISIEGTSIANEHTITMHSKELTINTVLVDGKAATWNIGVNDELTISHDDIIPGKHLVVIGFSGIITDAMHGMYPCYYEHDGQKKELLATQFESHHAREVFPCIDEPEAKATFSLTLTTETGVETLSNMPIEWQREEEGRLVTSFEKTPRMSTYLLAWVVGELHKKTAQTNDGVEVNVWATPAQPAESLDFALDIAVKSIEFYNDYFGTPYPLAKSDHVALPDFSSGAMENWGLITYREIALLANPSTTSISSKQYIATVIAHELAHQWFGNLVTMKWWNNLWLNESFATLMEYIAVDAIHPEWDIWLDFTSHETALAMRRDAIDGVQAVQVDVQHPDEISTLFDGAIVYAKGARLLRMLRAYIGDEAFRTGLQAYFSEHAYKNTESDDLWSALSKSSGKDIAALMDAWLSTPGYPIVSVKKEQAAIHLSQQQFFVGEHTPSAKLWPIPLNASWVELPELFNQAEASVAVGKHEQPLLVNQNATAHYIAQYDDDLLSQVLAAVTAQSVPEIDRLSLLNDAILLARSERIRTAELLPIISAYKNETSEPVWGNIASTLVELRKFVETNAAAEKNLKKLTAEIARKQYERLGWEQRTGEPESDTKLRGTIISMMLYGEDEHAIKTALSAFETTPLESLNAELRSLIISAVIRHSPNSPIASLLKTYQITQDAELAQDLCAGMTSANKSEDITALLSAITDGETVRSQDVARWFAYLIRNKHARTATWSWMTEHWDWIEQAFGSDKSYDDYPRYSAAALTTANQLAEYKDFFAAKRAIPALTRVIDLGITEISARVSLIEKDTEAVAKALAEVDL